MQHKGDLIVDGDHETSGQVTGTTYVRSGGRLIANGQLAGGLIIEPGGIAVVHGQVARNVINHGTLTLYGQVAGKVIGHSPVNRVGPNQIVGNDLEVPFRGTTISWTSSQ
ncbi:hypothetical protein [Paraburkholderia dinghuensis]|uniref:Polymer-forming cytoskeletal protein n=1 Tax=Paraburkholderia dinghuensis TaxID=2305225 RepID=A0A3N6P6M1_9BURK|nr:hypothetical protein [Paraburkholderia dinghuensis]RQH09593.1 hypothetical protein D1Y85_00020 [Paraburkholderia dinghuensis]